MNTSSHRRCSIKVYLKVSQNSQESTCVRVSFLIKFQVSATNRDSHKDYYIHSFLTTTIKENISFVSLQFQLSLIRTFKIVPHIGSPVWWPIAFLLIFRWGTHLYMSPFPSLRLTVRLSVDPSRTISQEPYVI